MCEMNIKVYTLSPISTRDTSIPSLHYFLYL